MFFIIIINKVSIRIDKMHNKPEQNDNIDRASSDWWQWRYIDKSEYPRTIYFQVRIIIIHDSYIGLEIMFVRLPKTTGFASRQVKWLLLIVCGTTYLNTARTTRANREVGNEIDLFVGSELLHEQVNFCFYVSNIQVHNFMNFKPCY